MPPSPNALSSALDRVRTAIKPKLETERATRDIRLGLERINLVTSETQTWNGVHVGGTNGKGSICAFLSGLFDLAGISYGRFVSPAFPDKRNAVTLNGRYPHPRAYDTEVAAIRRQYEKLQHRWRVASKEDPGPLSPFEMETATAFRLFNRSNVKYGIVEVGMGGATDATNAMRRKSVTVISKIGLDHQEYLGKTIKEIAKVKAGIMRPGVPCIVDYTNPEPVLDVLRKHADEIGTRIISSDKAEPILQETFDNQLWQLEDYQRQNLLCAALAFETLFKDNKVNCNQLLETSPFLPGRLEKVDVSELTHEAYQQPLLVDAAHNLLGIQALARHVDSRLRADDKPITWIMGMSSSSDKPIDEMIKTLIKPQDNVAFIEYSRQENQPPATSFAEGHAILKEIVIHPDQLYTGDLDIHNAVQWATSKAGDGQVIFTGSLYLIRDFFQLDGVQRNSREIKTRPPGVSQLRRLCVTWRHRPLTEEEFKDFEEAKLQWENSPRVKAGKAGPLDKTAYDIAASAADETGDAAHNGLDGHVVGQHTIQNEVPARYHLPEEIRRELHELQRTAEHLKKQVEEHRSSLKSTKVDIRQETREDALAQLREREELLSKQLEEHRKSLKQAQDALRNHPDAAKEFTFTDQELFGHVRRKSKSSSASAEGKETGYAGKIPREQRQAVKRRFRKKTVKQKQAEETQAQPKDFWGRSEDFDNPGGSQSR